MKFRFYNRNRDRSYKRLIDIVFSVMGYDYEDFMRAELSTGCETGFSMRVSFTKMYVEEKTIGVTLAIPFLLFFHLSFCLPWLEKMKLYSKFVGEDNTKVKKYEHSDSLYFKNYAGSRTFGVGWYCEFLTFYLGRLEDNCSFRSSPGWREITIDVPSFFLGKVKHDMELIATKNVKVPMSEKEYDAVVMIYNCKWKRTRSPFTLKLLRGEIKCKEGIPYPGKGTCDYNQGEDRTYSLSCLVNNRDIDRATAEMVGKMVESVFYCRTNYPL